MVPAPWTSHRIIFSLSLLGNCSIIGISKRLTSPDISRSPKTICQVSHIKQITPVLGVANKAPQGCVSCWAWSSGPHRSYIFWRMAAGCWKLRRTLAFPGAPGVPAGWVRVSRTWTGFGFLAGDLQEPLGAAQAITSSRADHWKWHQYCWLSSHLSWARGLHCFQFVVWWTHSLPLGPRRGQLWKWSSVIRTTSARYVANRRCYFRNSYCLCVSSHNTCVQVRK